MARYVKVLTTTGQWVYMRVLWSTRIHSVVVDANGNRYVTTGVKRGR